MNQATVFAAAFTDELARCGLAEAVLAPGSRNTPLALALWRHPEIRLHVRIDERSAAFTALGLAKAGGAPVAVVCTSGTAAAHFHAAVIEADEARVPLLLLTADRPPELRGTGASQAIDQVKLYGSAVRLFAEAGQMEPGAAANGYWRSLACRAWASAAGAVGSLPGPVHVNVPLREPLVPDAVTTGGPDGRAADGDAVAATGGGTADLAGRPDGSPWTAFPTARPPMAPPLELPWAERGLILCGDGTGDPAPLWELAAAAGWPVLAEPSSGARSGPHALSAYPYLLADPEFVAAHIPDMIVTAGRPGLSRDQLALLKAVRAGGGGTRHVVLTEGPGRWSDPVRTATDVAGGVRLAGQPAPAASARPAGGVPNGQPAAPAGEWLAAWRAADQRARQAADAVLDAEQGLNEPQLARDLAAALGEDALLWAASSLPVRDLDHHMAARRGPRVLANRGTNGIDGLVSAATGAALAHQAAGGGSAVALLGDLAFLHDLPGLVTGPEEPRPDLVLLVVNNNGGGIFSLLEQAALDGPFERLFGTPHGAGIAELAAGARLDYQRLAEPGGLPAALRGTGLRVVEARTSREAGAALRARLAKVCQAAAGAAVSGGGTGQP